MRDRYGEEDMNMVWRNPIYDKKARLLSFHVQMCAYSHMMVVIIGAILTCYGICNGTTIVSLFTSSGWIGWVFISCAMIAAVFIDKDFRLGCWMDMLEFTRLDHFFHHFFNWRIVSIFTGVFLSWFFNIAGNFIADGSALSILSPIGSIDLGFGLMRTNIRTIVDLKSIILRASMNFVGSSFIISILTWYILPFWISDIAFLDCLALGAICSCVDPSFCNKSLGLERRTTRSLHYFFVGESVVSSFLGGLVILCIQYQINCTIFWYCAMNIIIYLLSGLLGKWLGQIYTSIWGNYEEDFSTEKPMFLCKVSVGIMGFFFVALSISSLLQLDLGMAAVTFSTITVHLRGVPPLTMYNYISSYLDVGSYMQIGILAWHKQDSWSGCLLVWMRLLFISMLGRVPATLHHFHYYMNDRVGAELLIVWLAGLVRGASSLGLALIVFGTGLNESNKILMSATISLVLVTNLIIGPFSSWIVSHNFPPTTRDEDMTSSMSSMMVL